MKKRLNELRAQRAQVAADVRKLIEDNTGEKWNADCTAKADTAYADIDRIDAELKRIERALEVDASVNAAIDRRADTSGQSLVAAQGSAEQDMAAFLSWARNGLQEMPDDLRAVARSRIGQVQGAGIGTGAGGGFTVPQEFLAVLETALRGFGGMRDAATIIRTGTGADMPMPTNNDTGNSGVILAENTQMATLDVTFAQITLRAFMYASGLVPVSYQLLQDTQFDMGTWLAQQLATRLARIENTHFTLGTGTGQPAGIANATVGASIGVTLPTGNTSTLTYPGLVQLEHSVDPTYRRAGARWMMSDTALQQIRLIVDTQNRPIFVPGYQTGSGAVAGAPDTLMGYPIVINQSMPVPAANARSVAFGDMSKYLIREVLGPQVVRLNERFADALQVAFIGFQRADGRLVDAGTNPVRVLQQSAA